MVPKALVYLLDHKYTDAHLRLSALKGLDKTKAEYLQATHVEASVCLYLANMEYSKSGAAEEDYSSTFHELEDIFEENMMFRRMVDLDGHLLAQDIQIDESNVVQGEPFERDPDNEDYEGYTGNVGASATHWFRDTASRKTCLWL